MGIVDYANTPVSRELVSAFTESRIFIAEQYTTSEQALGQQVELAKIVPLFVLLMGDVLLALSVARLAFRLPFRGNFLLFLTLSGFYLFVGIRVGIMLATISRNQHPPISDSTELSFVAVYHLTYPGNLNSAQSDFYLAYPA